MRTLAEFAPVAISVQTLERFLYVNPAWEELTGYSRAEALEMPALKIVDSEMRAFVVQRAEARERGERVPARYELKGVRKSGEPFWFEMTVRRLEYEGQSAVLTIALDTTEHRATQLALAESERRLRTLMDNLPGMAYRCANTEGWPMDFVSQGVEQLTGYSPKEISGSGPVTYGDLIHPDDQETVWNDVQEAVAIEGPFELEYRLCARDGTKRWVWERGRAVPSEGGSTAILEGFVSDITDRKRSEHALRELEHQLRQSQKMEAIGQLAGGVAHDFNNILQAMVGYARLLGEPLLEVDEQKRYLAELEDGIERAATLTSQLLAFGRQQVLQLQPLDVDEVARSMVSMLRRLIGEHIHLEYIPPSEDAVATADRGQIEQVLLNLGVNSRDAMTRGGELTVAVENRRLEADFCSREAWARPGTYVAITVSDTGCGMDAETLEHIFEPFFSTKAPGEGSGLGLATVYGIVQQHDGLIHVRSEPGSGTAVEVYLPADSRPVPRASTAAEHAATGGAETLLLAEDDRQVREVAQRVLESSGYTVLAAADGEEALELFREHKDSVDVALLDVVMPHLDGPTVAKRMRAWKPELPIVFASGYPAGVDLRNGGLDKNVRLLPKPYRAGQLLATIREALDGDTRHPGAE